MVEDQNAYQFKGVTVVLRGRAHMVNRLDEAIRSVFAKIEQEGGVVQQAARTTEDDHL